VYVLLGVKQHEILISLTEQHSAVSPGIGLSSLWRSAADSWYTYGVSGAVCPAPDTSHLFPVGVVCRMPQYFKQELFFSQLTGFYFFISRIKRGPFLVLSVIKHIHNTQNTKLLHTASQTIVNCLLQHYSPTMYLLVLVFHQEKNGFDGNVQSTMKW